MGISSINKCYDLSENCPCDHDNSIDIMIHVKPFKYISYNDYYYTYTRWHVAIATGKSAKKCFYLVTFYIWPSCFFSGNLT